MNKRPNKWLVFSGLIFQIGIVMFIFINLGIWIESKIDFGARVPTILCCLLGLVLIIFLIQKQSKNIDL